MPWLNVLGLSIGLAMDAFAVSIAAGMSLPTVTRRHTFRMAFHFGLFQFLMPIIGWAVGREFAVFFADYDHWVAFGLLAFIGGKMLLDAKSTNDNTNRPDPTRGLVLITLSIATSIDALAVGLGMAFMRISVWGPAVLIGLVAALLSAIGITCGSRFGPRVGSGAEACGGCILIAIGLKILISHLVAA